MDFVYMTNEITGGSTEVADEPGVVEHFEARGWKVEKRPEPAPFVPSPLAPDATQYTEFIRLYHPQVDAYHEFPNNPEAIEGAYEAGWVFQEEKTETEATEDTPAEKPVKKTRSKSDGPAVTEKGE
jgi:hypothetical protein